MKPENLALVERVEPSVAAAFTAGARVVILNAASIEHLLEAARAEERERFAGACLPLTLGQPGEVVGFVTSAAAMKILTDGAGPASIGYRVEPFDPPDDVLETQRRDLDLGGERVGYVLQSKPKFVEAADGVDMVFPPVGPGAPRR